MNKSCLDFMIVPETPPDIEPVTLDEMKAHLRVTETADDEVITGLIEVSRQWAEDFTGKAFIDQQWRMVVGSALFSGDNVSGRETFFPNDAMMTRSWVNGEIILRRTPVIEVVEVVVIDSTGVETTVDTSDYVLRTPTGRWPSLVNPSGGAVAGGRVEIVFRAGYVNTTVSPQQSISLVPKIFIQAIKLHCEAMYDRDEKMMDKLIKAAENLLRPFSSNLQMA